MKLLDLKFYHFLKKILRPPKVKALQKEDQNNILIGLVF